MAAAAPPEAAAAAASAVQGAPASAAPPPAPRTAALAPQDAAFVAAWAEALRLGGASLPELAQALLRPPAEAQRLWASDGGRCAWLCAAEALAAAHRLQGQRAEITSAALRKGLGLLGAHLVTALAVGLALAAAGPRGPFAAAALAAAPCASLPPLWAMRRRHPGGLAALGAHSVGLGALLAAAHWELQWAAAQSSGPAAAAVVAAAVAAAAGGRAARALYGSDPDDSLLLAVGASLALQLAVYVLVPLLLWRPYLSAETVRALYFGALGSTGVLAAVAGTLARWALGNSGLPDMEAEGFRCTVDRTPWGITMVRERGERGHIKVLHVLSGSPAERAGVHVGDRVVRVAGQPLLERLGDNRDTVLRRAHALFSQPVPFIVTLQRA